MRDRASLLRGLLSRGRIGGFLMVDEFNILYFTGFRVERGRRRLLIPMDGDAILYVYGVRL